MVKLFLKTDITAKVLRIPTKIWKTFNFRDELQKKNEKKKQNKTIISEH